MKCGDCIYWNHCLCDKFPNNETPANMQICDYFIWSKIKELTK